MDIKAKIKSYRKENNLTQQDFGALIGKSAATIRKYESGELIPPPDVLELAQKVMGILPARMVVTDIVARQLLLYFERLNQDARNRIIDYAEILSMVEKFKK